MNRGVLTLCLLVVASTSMAVHLWLKLQNTQYTTTFLESPRRSPELCTSDDAKVPLNLKHDAAQTVSPDSAHLRHAQQTSSVTERTLNREVSERLKDFADPAWRKALKNQAKTIVRRENTDVASAIGLDVATESALIELLSENSVLDHEAHVRAAFEGASQAAQQAAFEARRAELEQQLVLLLGRDRFKEYERYIETAPERRQLRTLRMKLDESNAMTTAQANKLVSAMQEERNAYFEQLSLDPSVSLLGDHYPFLARPLSTDLIQQAQFSREHLDKTRTLIARLHSRAADILSAEQLRRFDELNEEQLFELSAVIKSHHQ